MDAVHESARAAARVLGDIKYRGHPCPHCGGVERYTSSRACVPCTIKFVLARRGPRLAEYRADAIESDRLAEERRAEWKAEADARRAAIERKLAIYNALELLHVGPPSESLTTTPKDEFTEIDESIFNELDHAPKQEENDNGEDPETRCPKCGSTSGDSWSQCQGICPQKSSPHYSEDFF